MVGGLVRETSIQATDQDGQTSPWFLLPPYRAVGPPAAWKDGTGGICAAGIVVDYAMSVIADSAITVFCMAEAGTMTCSNRTFGFSSTAQAMRCCAVSFLYAALISTIGRTRSAASKMPTWPRSTRTNRPPS